MVFHRPPINPIPVETTMWREFAFATDNRFEFTVNAARIIGL